MNLLLEIATILGGIAAVWFFLQQLSGMRSRKLNHSKGEYQGTNRLITTDGLEEVHLHQSAPSLEQGVPAQQLQQRTTRRDVTKDPSRFAKWLSDYWAALPETVEDLTGDFISGLLLGFVPFMLLFFSLMSVGFQIGLYIASLLSLESPFASKEPNLAGFIAFGSSFLLTYLILVFGKLVDDDSSNTSKGLFIYAGLLAGLYITKQLAASYFLVPAIGCITGAYTVFVMNVLNDRYRMKVGLPERGKRSP